MSLTRKDLVMASDGSITLKTEIDDDGVKKGSEKIKNAFLNYPYIIGGNMRLDSEIINSGRNIIAKVGAGGLCVVVNIEKEECLVIKIADSNMEARSFAIINSMLQLKWLDKKEILSNPKNIYIKDIRSQDNEVLGRIEPCFIIE